MKIGIIPNVSKKNILDFVYFITNRLRESKLQFVISEAFLASFEVLPEALQKAEYNNNDEIFKDCDIIISIGGDGTMLTTAYDALKYNSPIIGINFGKLGFLAELDDHNLNELIENIVEGKYIIEERMALEAVELRSSQKKLYSINDFVIDKGRWVKMIDLTIKVDDEYVSTFAADGIIIATPTGSTGYSLSAGGPIVNPKANVITISPISPHTLTMRPLVLSSEQKITITVNSAHSSVQVNCDGQRVHYYDPPATFEIRKSEMPIRLIHIQSTNYFQILRKKLYWGLDVRNNQRNRK
ncbi:MAG: NAD(+)/NADH kinase [Melioribacteraceae bacterium]|nr:NAD(+)/NADH kinase [Melioribacteraceae bacterium]